MFFGKILIRVRNLDNGLHLLLYLFINGWFVLRLRNYMKIKDMHMICVYILRERKQMHHPKNKVIEINPEQLGNTLCQAEILVIFT